MNFTIGPKPFFSNDDIARVDPRIWRFVTGWYMTQIYEKSLWTIPDFIPIKYYEVNEHPKGTPELERALTILCGWAGRSNGKDVDGFYHEEVIITVGVNAEAVLDPSIKKVTVQIMQVGGAPTKVFFRGEPVTDFTDKFLGIFKISNGHQTKDFSKYL